MPTVFPETYEKVRSGNLDSVKRKSTSFVVRQTPAEVLQFADAVRTIADSDKDSLGFYPPQVYRQAAQDGNIFVAVDVSGRNPKFAGHLWFGARYPQIKVHQLAVVPSMHGCGIGRILIESLVKFAEDRQFLTISARVADDLKANGFWNRLGFETHRREAGGNARKRQINVRIRHLETPTLFDCRSRVTGLPIQTFISQSAPVYAIDLNVLFDVIRKRTRAEYGAQLISAGLNNILRIVVAEEFIAELKRHTPSGNDPVLEFALQLQTMPPPPPDIRDQFIARLAPAVFPEHAKQNRLTDQDKSDLIHLVTAAYNHATGFITAEKALIRATDEIEAQLAIRVEHVEAFSKRIKKNSEQLLFGQIPFAGQTIHVSEETAATRSGLLSLLRQVEVPSDFRDAITATGIHATNRKSIVVSSGDRVLCSAAWAANGSLKRSLEALVLSDEDHPAIETALDALIYRLSRLACSEQPNLVQLRFPSAYVITPQVATCYGFMQANDSTIQTSRLHRLGVGFPITPAKWAKVRTDLQVLAGLIFPDALPDFRSPDFVVPFELSNGGSRSITFHDLESALSPTVMVLPGRNAALVPIQAAFAEELLDTSQQLSLMGMTGARLFHQRTYISAKKNARVLRKGTAVVFYESGKGNGRSCAIAIARVLHSAIVAKRELASAQNRHVVLAPEEINEITKSDDAAATTFDNVIEFRIPVPLKTLRNTGCIDATNLISARSITQKQLATIVNEGMAWTAHTS